ncbi:MAG: CRISPR-associated primase-polymerase type B [Saprospiraceae bacterium]
MILNDTSTLSFGLKCTDAITPLQQISLQELYHIIVDTTSPLVADTIMLRKIYSYSKERYRTTKATLPFISYSLFDPAIRKYDHFIHASGCILDIDLTEPLPPIIKSKLANDDRITLSFTSPNGYGIKLFFTFQSPFTDKLSYAAAYKAFTHEFGMQYGIIDKMDLKNCDVSRISFICHDASCVYNNDALKVDLSEYVINSPLTDHLPTQKGQDIKPEVYRDILTKLGGHVKTKRHNKPPYVPIQIQALLNPLSEAFKEYGIIIADQEEIQYGIKINGILGQDHGEIILYYGKKGYQVVSSARKGLHHELSAIMKQIVLHSIYSIP